MKKYVISSASFDTLEEAEKQCQKWSLFQELDNKARVYEVKSVYKPVIRLELDKTNRK